uniref:Uncharacterized protein n=1 Tax=Mesocestoides corti TaxID=53468 RepID=A0A5K3FCM3_MESCO
MYWGRTIFEFGVEFRVLKQVKLVEEDGHYSTYESVRAAAEQGTLSYQNLADIFSTIHEEQSMAPSQGRVRALKTPPPPRKPAHVVEEEHEESAPEHPLRPFIFGFLETLLNVIV